MRQSPTLLQLCPSFAGQKKGQFFRVIEARIIQVQMLPHFEYFLCYKVKYCCKFAGNFFPWLLK